MNNGTNKTPAPDGSDPVPPDTMLPPDSAEEPDGHQESVADPLFGPGDGISAPTDGPGETVGDGVGSAAEEQARSNDRREKVGKATFAITAFHMLGRVMGLVEAQVLAHLAGGGSVAGAYSAAGAVPQGIFSFGENLLTHSFLPPFVDAREKDGDESAWRLANLVGTVQLVVLLLTVLLGEIFTPWIVRQFTDFDAASFNQTVTLVRIMLPGVVMMSLASLTYVILNAYKQFGLPAFADAALKGGIVLAGVCLWKFLGVRAFALGLVVGAFAKLAIHLYGLRRNSQRIRWNLDFKQPYAGKLGGLMLPLMIGNLLVFIRPLIDIKYSGAASQVAARNFAFKLTNLPFLLVPYALSIALFPFLAEMATRGDKKQMSRALISALRMVTFLLVPVTAVYIMLALPLVQTVFQSGKFTTADSERVIGPFVWYSLGMLPLAFETVVLQIYFSLSDTKTPTIIAYATFLVYFAVAYGSTQRLGWEASGVALAFTLSKLAKVIILLFMLVPRLHGFNMRGVGSFLAKLSVATALMILVLWATVKVGYHAQSAQFHPSAAATAAAKSSHSGSQAASKGKTVSATATGQGSPQSEPAPSGSSLTSATSTDVPKGKAQPQAKAKKKGSGKIKAVVIFVTCAAPGFALFLLAAHLLRIEELATIYGVLQRRLGPVVRKGIRFSMAPW